MLNNNNFDVDLYVILFHFNVFYFFFSFKKFNKKNKKYTIKYKKGYLKLKNWKPINLNCINSISQYIPSGKEELDGVDECELNEQLTTDEDDDDDDNYEDTEEDEHHDNDDDDESSSEQTRRKQSTNKHHHEEDQDEEEEEEEEEDDDDEHGKKSDDEEQAKLEVSPSKTKSSLNVNQLTANELKLKSTPSTTTSTTTNNNNNTNKKKIKNYTNKRTGEMNGCLVGANLLCENSSDNDGSVLLNPSDAITHLTVYDILSHVVSFLTITIRVKLK